MPTGSPKPQTIATEKYAKKAGWISKSYKLKKDVVDEYTQACKRAGVSAAGQLTTMMKSFAKEVNGVKYHIIEKHNRNAREELKLYSFDELKDFFEPNEEFEESHSEWEEIEDLFDLREFLEHEADGMEVEYTIEEEPTGC